MNTQLTSRSDTEFIAAAHLGRSGWKYAAGALLLLISAWLVGNLVYYSVESSISTRLDPNASGYVLKLIFLCSTTTLLWLGMFLVAKFVLRRKIRTFVLFSRKFNLKLLGLGVIAFLVARAIDLLVLLVAGGRIGTPAVRWPDFAVTPVFATYCVTYVVVLIFQSAIEEITTRGFVMQSVFAIAKNKFASATITSILFVSLHPGNGVVFASTMLAASMWMAALCLVSDGLEMPIGFHFSNNVGAFFATDVFYGGYLNITAPAGSEWSLFILYALAASVTFAMIPLRRNRQRNS
ncbi:CPBP family intramembrane glutamic endopeptidase [Burkholderia sp. IMCC1007]|uniref:CPBP family intramembrane glutamic endopeptidase n=1 Tax=Burkholderia sp. IMCC1007 TaxID=3004104 RepID=UPI0022B534B4|nr:CPBP family intramembrane glutamic endopeptidase [Burkholderia sp. IMCC1007]